MKKILAIALVTMLPGCALVDAYLMTKYDPSEYRIITEIRTEANVYKKDCADPLLAGPNARALAEKTQLFANYSEHVPRNNNTIKAAVELNKIAQGLSDSYAKKPVPTAVFCKIKFETIENSSKTIQHVIGNRPR